MTAKRDKWQDYFIQPEAPSNYKEETADRFVKKKLGEQEKRAPDRAYSGYAKSITVVDSAGAVLLKVECPEGNTSEASIALVSFIHSDWYRRPYQVKPPSPAVVNCHMDSGIRWFCFNARHIIPMIFVEVLRYDANEGKDNQIGAPLRYWWAERFAQPPFEDPYDMLMPSTLRDDIDLSCLCEFFGLQLPWDIENNAEQRAMLTYKLARAGQLTSLPVSEEVDEEPGQ